jgi:hypothetical protein
MRRIQRLNRFQNSVAIAAVAVGLVASASVPAAAHTRAALLPVRAAQEHVQTHRQFTYAPNGLKEFVGVPPDYCDLPSAGCESYLSN